MKYVVIGLVCAVVVLGAASAWLIYQNQELGVSLRTVNAKYAALNSTNVALQQNFDHLFGEFTALNSNYNRLQTDYGSLDARYDSLETNYSALNMKYSTLGALYGDLEDSVRDLDGLMASLALFPQAIGRTLTDDEIMNVDWAVEHAVGSEQDSWEAERLIYGFINGTIAYEGDVVEPYLSDFNTTTLDGTVYITGFSVSYSPDYIASPTLTLFNGYGDCDDQAILGYAMIKYYERHIVGQEYNLYLALITFENDALHLCVIRPAANGYAFVFDPAGGYLSPNYGSTAASKALAELTAYSDYWAGYGGIKGMALYEVTDYYGNYVLVINGTVAEVASFLG